MDLHTSEAKKWLDERYSRQSDGHYYAHQPLYGYDSDQSEPNAILRLARTYHIFRILACLEFNSFLDVGGGEGYISGMTRNLFGVEAVSSDLSSEACQRAREIFGVQAVSSDASRLPFKDRSFDLVLCSEVIEHLYRPALAISELARLARKYVVITTSEFCPTGEFERRQRMCELDSSYPHAERNWYTHRDFRTLLGDGIVFHSQLDNLGGRGVDYFASVKLTKEQARNALDFLTRSSAQDPGRDGVIVIAPQGNAPELGGLEIAYQQNPRKEELFAALLNPYPGGQNPPVAAGVVDPDLVEKLMCLRCGSDCGLVEEQLVCRQCGAAYPVINGVPVMLPDEGAAPVAVHTEAYAVESFSKGDSQRAEGVRALMTKLHGERPVCTSPRRRWLATQTLRLIWLAKRPEPLRVKARRVLHKLKLGSFDEFEAIKKTIG